MAPPPAGLGARQSYGFEIFETNSLEQLCINYCNEKLQWFFNEHIFALEQAEYAEQGIDLSRVHFKDNSDTIELLEYSPKDAGAAAGARGQPRAHGVLAMLDEEIVVPRGSDKSLRSKLLRTHKDHPSFATPRTTARGNAANVDALSPAPLAVTAPGGGALARGGSRRRTNQKEGGAQGGGGGVQRGRARPASGGGAAGQGHARARHGRRRRGRRRWRRRRRRRRRPGCRHAGAGRVRARVRRRG